MATVGKVAPDASEFPALLVMERTERLRRQCLAYNIQDFEPKAARRRYWPAPRLVRERRRANNALHGQSLRSSGYGRSARHNRVEVAVDQGSRPLRAKRHAGLRSDGQHVLLEV